MPTFARRLIDWHRRHGRHDLPWQQTRDPYRVWLSEIMLQQTQVATVTGYYARFLDRFPTLADLASADLAEVMPLWSGLGYYARARHLHACARQVMSRHGEGFPHDPVLLATLPGIGRSTANAIAAFCFGARVPILDGNVKRVLCRFLGIAGFPGQPAVERRLWAEAAALLPRQDVATYIQAQMDLGATLCKRGRPLCETCPVAGSCVAHRTGRVAELPTPRPPKPLPEKSVTLLVVHHTGKVLLETRPPSGIWGGLQSLPELPDGEEAVDYCARHLGVTIDAVLPGPTLTHGFTHFRLRMTPLACAARAARRPAGGRLWATPDRLAGAALPAPIRRLLEGFSATL